MEWLLIRLVGLHLELFSDLFDEWRIALGFECPEQLAKVLSVDPLKDVGVVIDLHLSFTGLASVELLEVEVFLV